MANWLREPAHRDIIKHWTAAGDDHVLTLPPPPDPERFEFLALGDSGDSESSGALVSPQDAVARELAADAALPGRLRAGAIRIGAVALVSALPMTFVVAWTMSLVQPGRVFAPGQLPALFAAVAAVQLLIVFATTATAPAAGRAEAPGRAPDLPEPAAEAAPAAFPSALLSRLPPGIGTDIFALETEDHYLRVHAAGGSALILMRMADAVALLDPRLGAQVHRRWWVAQGAVAGVRTEGQRLYLCLNDETQVPVGRTFSASAKARFAHARRLGPPGQALTIRERSPEKNAVEGLRE